MINLFGRDVAAANVAAAALQRQKLNRSKYRQKNQSVKLKRLIRLEP